MWVKWWITNEYITKYEPDVLPLMLISFKCEKKDGRFPSGPRTFVIYNIYNVLKKKENALALSNIAGGSQG